jgi:hypothetical protein
MEFSFFLSVIKQSLVVTARVIAASFLLAILQSGDNRYEAVTIFCFLTVILAVMHLVIPNK